MTTTPRINVTYHDEQIIEDIDEAATSRGMSRSAFIIEAAHRAATRVRKKNDGDFDFCEICAKDVTDDYHTWSRYPQRGIGYSLCSPCYHAIEALPEEAAVRAIVKKPKRKKKK